MACAEVCTHVQNLVRSARFAEALAFFKEHKTECDTDAIRGAPYLLQAMLKALRKAGHSSAGIPFIDLYVSPLSQSTNEHVLNAAAWVCYDVLKEAADNASDSFGDVDSGYEDDEGQNQWAKLDGALQHGQTLVKLLAPMNNDYARTAAINCFRQIARIVRRKKGDWGSVVDMARRFDPDKLSKDCFTSRQDGKERELASPRENWYAITTRALLETGDYDRCMEVAARAEEEFEKLHFGNHIWIPRCRALALARQGRYSEGAEMLERLCRRKAEYFMLSDLASVYHAAGEHKKALCAACASMITPPHDLGKKGQVLKLLADILEACGQRCLAAKHVALCSIDRIKRGWRVKDTLAQRVCLLCEREPSLDEHKALLSDLQLFWQEKAGEGAYRLNKGVCGEHKGQTGTVMTGTVSRVLNHNHKGVDGFITPDNGVGHYFRMQSQEELVAHLREGVRVEFQSLPPMQGKKHPVGRVMRCL